MNEVRNGRTSDVVFNLVLSGFVYEVTIHGQVARMVRTMCGCIIFGGMPLDMRPRRRPECRWENSTETDFRQVLMEM
jgi:hypothetical protein